MWHPTLSCAKCFFRTGESRCSSNSSKATATSSLEIGIQSRSCRYVGVGIPETWLKGCEKNIDHKKKWLHSVIPIPELQTVAHEISSQHSTKDRVKRVVSHQGNPSLWASYHELLPALHGEPLDNLASKLRGRAEIQALQDPTVSENNTQFIWYMCVYRIVDSEKICWSYRWFDEMELTGNMLLVCFGILHLALNIFESFIGCGRVSSSHLDWVGRTWCVSEVGKCWQKTYQFSWVDELWKWGWS